MLFSGRVLTQQIQSVEFHSQSQTHTHAYTSACMHTRIRACVYTQIMTGRGTDNKNGIKR